VTLRFGCEIASSQGGMKFLSDDKDIECEGTRDGKVCASKVGSCTSWNSVGSAPKK
jgi:hypothetical protein